jgi:hypothetical protein
MAEVTGETAYYLNAALSTVALIAKGVRFPAGQWIRIADGTATPASVDHLVPDLFPAFRGRQLRSRVLLTDFDVEEFESAERRDPLSRRRL